MENEIPKGHFATNENGEVKILVGGQWTTPEQKATNEAGDEAYLVGGKWMIRRVGSTPQGVAQKMFPDQPPQTPDPQTPEMPDPSEVYARARGLPMEIPGGGMMGDKTPAIHFFRRQGKYEPIKGPDGKPLKELGAERIPGKSNVWHMKMGAAFIAEPDAKRRAKIIEFNLPGAKTEVRGDDVIITLPNGEQRILNQRGMSFQDIADTISEIGKIFVVARTAGAGAGILGMSARAGAATGGVEAVTGAGSAFAGSGKTLGDVVGDTAAATALGAGGTLLVGTALKGLMRNGRMFKGDQLSLAGKALLRKNNINPDDLTPETLRQLKPILAKAKNPEEAVRLAEARGLNVQPTRGQITRDPAQLGREDVLAKGGAQSLGDDASRLAALRQGQSKALENAGDEVAGRVTGAPRVDTRGASMKGAQDRLNQLYTAERKAVKTAYDAARNGNVKISTEALKDYATQLRQVAQEYTDPQVRTAVRSILQKIEQKGVTSLSLTALENARKLFTNLKGNPSQFSAAARLRKIHDGVMNGLDDSAFKRGSKESVKAYRDAVARRKEMAKKFDDDPNIMAGVGKSRVGDDLENIAPEEFAQKIFGKSGVAPSKGADKTIMRLKATLGKDSAEFQGVKNEAFSRIFQGNPESWNGRLTRFLRDSPAVAKELFTKAEIAQLRTLARSSDTLLNAPAGVYNNSGSGINLLRDNPFIKRMPIVGQVARYPENVGNDMFARRAMQPLIRAPEAGYAAALGGAVAGGDDDRRKAIMRMLQGQ